MFHDRHAHSCFDFTLFSHVAGVQSSARLLLEQYLRSHVVSVVEPVDYSAYTLITCVLRRSRRLYFTAAKLLAADSFVVVEYIIRRLHIYGVRCAPLAFSSAYFSFMSSSPCAFTSMILDASAL